ncbi:hypothetical protein Igni_1285 [Ignicoccus hospitalis KIN4/I]|uniref:DUF6884 domain-containing protein n=1 Tax=Ignicoccus hospitalis (strain KIN4/I / DSM 18386 / JCM 14125) TaxID=453591 RepID=A8AC09_IGNH4|nr:hypothetical protein Igni_1285 [Ignicoccus hospitalis KIN4/I]
MFVLAERLGARCFVLSAKYALIECDARVEPYELYLGELGPEERERLKRRVGERCDELRGPWYLAVVNLSGRYSEVFPCRVEARYAVVIGKVDVVSAEKALRLVPKTIGQRNSALKALGRARSLEDVIRLIEEGTFH